MAKPLPSDLGMLPGLSRVKGIKLLISLEHREWWMDLIRQAMFLDKARWN